MKASNPCMFCGRELRAMYPYYKLLMKENAWRRPRTVGRICEDCMEKAKSRIAIGMNIPNIPSIPTEERSCKKKL